MNFYIFHGTAEKLMETPWQADMIFMDPPDNLGLKYDGFTDSRSDYYDWLAALVGQAWSRAPVVWLSYYHAHDVEIKRRLSPMMGNIRTFVWTFGFGQNRRSDCGSGYRPILRLGEPAEGWDAESIKEPSVRMALGDSRADPTGSVPLDVWDFPRVAGNFGERRAWHPTQHPVALYIRAMKLSGALRGSFRAIDLFGGSGTLLHAATQLYMKNPLLECMVSEQSKKYCMLMSQDTGVPIVDLIPTSWIG